MNFSDVKKENVLEVDIHNYSQNEAKFYLERLISMVDNNYKEIVVIHGWRRGNELMHLVRNGLTHKRIARKLLMLNPGRTVLMLKDKS